MKTICSSCHVVISDSRTVRQRATDLLKEWLGRFVPVSHGLCARCGEEFRAQSRAMVAALRAAGQQQRWAA